MIEISAQFDGKSFLPFTERDRDEAADFKKNQVVILQVRAIRKIPSIEQLGLYWSACTLFAENTEDRNFKTKDMVSEQLKVALNFVDLNKSFVDKHGNFHPHYMSISFDNLKQIERTKYVDRAFDQLAEWMGTDRETLVFEAKERCKK